MKKITILVPCYNEEKALHEFYKRMQAIVNTIPDYEFEMLFVNDGSTDHTLEIIQELRFHDKTVSYVDLSRNYGQEIALIAGIDYVNSDAMIIMDADLQDPPELVPIMIEWWEKGYKDVCAKRRSRAGETWFKKWSSKSYYKILQRMSTISIQQDVGYFRLFDRQCIEAIKLLRESQRYTKGIFSWIGFEKKEILFDRDARVAGETKWNYVKLFELAIEGITSFTIAPLRIATILGTVIVCVAVIYFMYVIIASILFGGRVAGYQSLITIVLLMSGLQLCSLGIIGEYLGRVFNEGKNRPLYFVKKYNDEVVINRK